MSVSGVPASPAWVIHADNSLKSVSFMPRLYRNLLRGRVFTGMSCSSTSERLYVAIDEQNLFGQRSDQEHLREGPAKAGLPE